MSNIKAEMRTSWLGASIAAIAVVLPLNAFNGAAAPAGLTFTHRLVEPGWTHAEPTLDVGNGVTPTIVYTTDERDAIWISTTGGASWTRKLTPTTSNQRDQSAVSIDAGGAVYLAHIGGGRYPVPAQTSFDQGATWTNLAYLGRGRVCGGNGSERLWSAARASGEVVHVAACTSEDPAENYAQDVFAWTSTNGGVTYTKTFPARRVEVVGPVAFAGAATIYVAYADLDWIYVAKSTNGGATWTIAPVAQNVRLQGFPVVDADDAGNVYMAWARRGTLSAGTEPVQLGAVLLARSTDGGTNWSTPVVVSDAMREAASPWISAGAAGRVAVSYFAATGPAFQTYGTPLTSWNIDVAQSLDAASASPQFTIDTAVTGVRTGNLCPNDNYECTLVERMKFFQTDIDDAGHLYIAYAKDRGLDGPSTADLMIAVQSAGPTLR